MSMGRLALLAALISTTCGFRVLQPKELREKAIYELHKDRRGLLESMLGSTNQATNAWDTCDGCVGVCNGENKWYCRDLSEGQGSCESHDDCYEDLLCGKQNCSWWYAECACRDDLGKATKPCGTFTTRKSCEKNLDQLGCSWHGTELDENVVCLLEDPDPNKWDKEDNCCYSKEALTSAEAEFGDMDGAKPVPPVEWFIITLCTVFGCFFLICLGYCLERMIKHKRHPFFWDGNKLCCICYAIYGKTHKTQDHDVYELVRANKEEGEETLDRTLTEQGYREKQKEEHFDRNDWVKAEKFKTQKIGCCPKNDPEDKVCQGGFSGAFTGCCKFTTQKDGDGRCAWTVKCCVIRMDEGIKKHGWWMDDDDDIDPRLGTTAAIPGQRLSKFETTLEHKAKRKQYDELEKAAYMKEARKIKRKLIEDGYKGFEPKKEVQFKCCGMGKKCGQKILVKCPKFCRREERDPKNDDFHVTVCCCCELKFTEGTIVGEDGEHKEIDSMNATSRASTMEEFVKDENRKSKDNDEDKRLSLRMWGKDSFKPKDDNETVMDINKRIPRDVMEKLPAEKKKTLRNLLSIADTNTNESHESKVKGVVNHDGAQSPTAGSSSPIGSGSRPSQIPFGATYSNPRKDEDDNKYRGRQSLPVGASSFKDSNSGQAKNQNQEVLELETTKEDTPVTVDLSEYSAPVDIAHPAIEPQVPLPTLPGENPSAV